MAKVKNNIITEGLSGKLGDQLIVKQYAYGTVMSKYPDMSNVKFNDKQKAAQEQFRQSCIYAKSINDDPVLRAAAEKRLTGKGTIYHQLQKEYRRLMCKCEDVEM